MPSIEAAAMKRRSWVINMKRLKTWLTTGGERFIDAEEETSIFLSVIGYKSV